MTDLRIYIGWDPREEVAWRVAHRSLLKHLSQHAPVTKLALGDLQSRGIYRRPTVKREDGRLIDMASVAADYDGAMATEHANARFFVPHLLRAPRGPETAHGWALFMDGDILVREDIAQVFRFLDDRKALYCVHHNHRSRRRIKMDGVVQTSYRRKNWSSFMLFNLDHPAHRRLTLDNLNALPGRDLHGFYWLFDEEIGELDWRWNYLVGHSVAMDNREPIIVHFTEGAPDMPGYENCEYADEWWGEAAKVQRQEVEPSASETR